MTIKDPTQAFEQAIKTGRLSADPDSATYAGQYMYMCTGADGRDQFKHSTTREYLTSTCCEPTYYKGTRIHWDYCKG